MIEEWRDIVGYEELYQISDTGRVRSTRQTTNTYVGRILRPSKKKKGKSYYEYVCLSKNGVVKTLSVHRMEAVAFLGLPIGDKRCVRHLDGNSPNNDIINLKWGSYSENTQDSIHHGTFRDNAGSKHGMSKLTESMIHRIRQMSLKMSRRDISNYFKVSISTIDDVINGKTWKHIN